MYFLLSGEGVTDMGSARADKAICESDDFAPGPMALVVAQVVERVHDYSILDGACGLVSDGELARRCKGLRVARKGPLLPGKKRPKETRYYFLHARALARMALAKQKKDKDEIVAILFHDADGTVNAGRGLWDEKWDSIKDGFEEEGYALGVPMVPNPKSEAWLICAWKKHPYQGCAELEERSGNDRSPKSLKAELEQILGEQATPELLCDRVRNSFDVDRIDMPSFARFRARLEEVIQAEPGTPPGRK